MSDSAAVTATGAAPAVHRPVGIPALTGLRAVAAAVIVAHHLRALVDVIVPHPIASAVRPVLLPGFLAVDVFFLLSGFVIAHNYAHVLTDHAPGAWRSYVHARVARIYPLHLVTFFVFCLLLATGALTGRQDFTGQEHTAFGFVGNLLMLQGLPGVVAWNFPSWSLTCEFAAYLVFPLVAARVLRLRWGTALLVGALTLGLQLMILYRFGGADPASIDMGLPRVMGEFVAGAMGWVVWRHALRAGRWADVVIVLCTIAVWWLLLSGHSWLWTVPLFAVMIPAAASATGPVGRLLGHPATQWAGRVSFAVYLVHALVSTATIMWVIPADMYTQHSTHKAALVLGGMFIASWVLGALLHHGVEEPARRWLRRRSTALAARSSAASDIAPVGPKGARA